ncbi:SOS response-associated peptidase [Actinotalea sp. M2MS4P-6]|uniref:SOS response-associated peptidase n=1 Tax=Actinotalea sp. M2MS4P-6 TaxID=2983762 RepID=UPI0021E4703C|nr:SOS response-associated peptidase [Actinotalea sp. M2MS4P-6]MCV2393522.1 SOS response-associated peptidase [Actinotalea sp. M2MS4P-6]
MCGRYASFRAAQDLADAFGVDPEDVAEDAAGLPPSWNLAPTDPVRIVVERPEKLPDGTHGDLVRSLRLARWGLVPGWAKDPSVGSRMINARIETLAEKPAFRKALAARRCLVPAEGYYEWTDPPAGAPKSTRKTPHWIHPADGGLLAFAGLYEFWRDPTRADDDPHRWLVSMTIVTGGAPADDPVIGPLHDRQPVLVTPDRWSAWLDPDRTPQDALALLGDAPTGLTAVPVSTDVSSVRNDGPHLIEPV